MCEIFFTIKLPIDHSAHFDYACLENISKIQIKISAIVVCKAQLLLMH